MSSQTQLSLCIPYSSDLRQTQDFYNSVNQFFLKFPLQYEVVFAVQSPDEGRALLTALAENETRVRFVETKFSARAKNYQLLFEAAKGDILVAMDVTLKIPLGEIFKMLQELYTDASLDVVFGNRFEKLKKVTAGSVVPRPRLETFFQGIIHEKAGWPFRDSFCPTFAIRKASFLKLLPELDSKGWHWTHEVQRAVIKTDLKPIEVPIFDRSQTTVSEKSKLTEQKPSAFVESLRLLSFVVFRI